MRHFKRQWIAMLSLIYAAVGAVTRSTFHKPGVSESRMTPILRTLKTN